MAKYGENMLELLMVNGVTFEWATHPAPDP